MVGIASYAAYLPAPRLDAQTINAFLGKPGRAATRTVASFDEDTTTMAVEAVRAASAGLAPQSLWFATSRPAYMEKSNAATVSVAGGLPEEVSAVDVGGALRSGAGALKAALQAGPGADAVAVMSDIRFGLPGSPEELQGADAAVAFTTTSDSGRAELIAAVSATSEFLDRWRPPGALRTRVWEERFAVSEYLRLAETATARVLEQAGLTLEQVDHVAVSMPHARSRRSFLQQLNPAQTNHESDSGVPVGYAGAADLGLRLASALDQAEADQTILVLGVADGADAFIFRTTPAHANGPSSGLAQAEQRAYSIGYGEFLSWRKVIQPEPPRRPDVRPPVPPASHRSVAWKYGFIAAECTSCGYRNLPPRRVCLRCSAVDQFRPISMVEIPGRIATFTDDWLSESVQLPARVVAIDFDGGGRFECEMADAMGRDLAIGDLVQPTFRLASIANNGVRNYVWKVRPSLEEEAK